MEVKAPVGDADFTLALEWEGTYLSWLPDRLLTKLFGPLQLLLTLEQVRFRCSADGPNDSWRKVCARGPVGWGEPWDQYAVPIKSECHAMRYDNEVYVKPTPAAAHVTKLRTSTRPRRRKRHKQAKREAFNQVLWFSDVLLNARGMHVPFRLLSKPHYQRVDIESVPRDGGPVVYDNCWEDRSKWPQNTTRLWERLGFSFEKPQQRYLGEEGVPTTYYQGHKRHLYDASRRAATTDLRDGVEGKVLWQKARIEWGTKFTDSSYARAARGEPRTVEDTRGAHLVVSLLNFNRQT